MRHGFSALLAPLLLGLLLPGCSTAMDPPPPTLAGFPTGHVSVVTPGGRHEFRVWIADDPNRRSQGLMFVKSLPADHGMLFVFEYPQQASFWMKDTPLSLDIVFIGPDGGIVNIARDTEPFSLQPIDSVAPVTTVLELAAGTAKRIGLARGDRVDSPRPDRLPLQR